MDIEYLKEFITLAEKLNFSQAAGDHYITQPALTKHIKQLETELGTGLFYRNRQKVRLTPMGELFLPEAEKIVSACADAVRVLREAQAQYAASLKISFLDPVIREEMPQWIKSFHEKFPDVQLTFSPTNRLTAAEQLNNHECDLAATLQMPDFVHPDFETLCLRPDPICLFVSKEHPLAGADSICLQDLNGESLLLPSEDFAKEFRRYMELRLKRANIKAGLIRYVNSAREAFLLTDVGAGIWLAPQHQRIFSSGNTVCIPVSDPEFYVNIVLMWPGQSANPNVEKLIRVITDSAGPVV